jgi:hypothetical protein
LVFSAIVYVHRTGCQCKALPRKYGSASTVQKYFQISHRAGFLQKLWQAGLAEYDGMHGIDPDQILPSNRGSEPHPSTYFQAHGGSVRHQSLQEHRVALNIDAERSTLPCPTNLGPVAENGMDTRSHHAFAHPGLRDCMTRRPSGDRGNADAMFLCSCSIC